MNDIEKNKRIEQQVASINNVLLYSSTRDFNEVRKQIRKYERIDKDRNFILHYIISSKHIFPKDINLKSIYNESNKEDKVEMIKNYIKELISMCWHLVNRNGDFHKYQIQMIAENYDTDKEPHLIYQKLESKTKGTGRNYINYIPFLDILEYCQEEEINEMIFQMDIFLQFYNIACEKDKNNFMQRALCEHPLFRLVDSSYSLFDSYIPENKDFIDNW